ncbi:MAG: hypothetical protein J6Z14_02265 [Prevotella sp.]|nr:hypothetical protein [Prevotella sp.]
MKEIKKLPIEVFGYDVTIDNDDALLAHSQQYCRFLKGSCNKPRKSEPEKKVGICTLGASLKGGIIKPVIVCPQRFKEDLMFDTIRKKYLTSWKNVKWVQEVNIGSGGSVDYVAVELDAHGVVRDFLCVEIQAAGTTGSPYPYVKELLEDGHFSGTRHSYGINWANEFSKTMMQQAFKKGKIVESWKRKIVFVVQDIAMEYLITATDCSLLTGPDPNSPVDFCSFSLVSTDDKYWNLNFDQIKSTSIAGISLMLGGANVNEYLTEEDFIGNIIRKGIIDGVFEKNQYTKDYL